MFLKSITFKRDVEFESKREHQKEMFEVKETIYFRTNYRKRYTNDEGEEIIPEEKIVENKFIIFNAGLTINLNPLTVIVGDNGSGKTSFIKNIAFPYEELMSPSFKDKEEHEKAVVSKWIKDDVRELNLLKMPKIVVVEQEIHKGSFIKEYIKRNSDASNYMNPQSLLTSWDLKTFSNGECNLDFLKGLEDVKDSIIVLDEPETSLSIKSQYKLKRLIENLLESNQVIIITHAEILMNLSDKVYDFEKKEYVITGEYIQEQKKFK